MERVSLPHRGFSGFRQTADGMEVSFEIPTALIKNITVLRDKTPCSLVEMYFGKTHCVRLHCSR
jgi:hypothetical protein